MSAAQKYAGCTRPTQAPAKEVGNSPNLWFSRRSNDINNRRAGETRHGALPKTTAGCTRPTILPPHHDQPDLAA